jgi:hypothetical protein
MERIGSLKDSFLLEKESLLFPGGPFVSAYLLGSHATQTATMESDVDILLVAEDAADGLALMRASGAVRRVLARAFPDERLFLFNSPDADRGDGSVSSTRRVQLLLHRRAWVSEYLVKKNWVLVNWARNHLLLIGDEILDFQIEPELNGSIVDEFDGLPSILRRIDNAILLMDPGAPSPEVVKTARYAFARCAEIRETFPQLNLSPQRTGLSELSPLDRLLAARTEVETTLTAVRERLS